MRAALLRHRIVFQSPADDAAGSYGGVTQTFSTVDTVWGRIEPLEGTERNVATQVNSEATFKVTCRYGSELSAIAPTWRITFAGRTFHIVSFVKPEERNIMLEVMVQEKQS